MKKIIIIIAILALIGCEKEEETKPVDCKCGVVEYVGGAWTPTGIQTRWNYNVRNNCTNAPLKMSLSSPYRGEEYCRDYQW